MENSNNNGVHQVAGLFVVIYNNEVICARTSLADAEAIYSSTLEKHAAVEYPAHDTQDYRNIKWIPRINRWQVRTSQGGKQKILGSYKTQADAVAAYTTAMRAAPILVKPVTPPTDATQPVRGIKWRRDLNRWVAHAYVGRKKHYVGRFRTQAEAITAQKRYLEIKAPYKQEPEQELPSIDRPAYEDYKDLL